MWKKQDRKKERGKETGEKAVAQREIAQKVKMKKEIEKKETGKKQGGSMIAALFLICVIFLTGCGIRKGQNDNAIKEETSVSEQENVNGDIAAGGRKEDAAEGANGNDTENGENIEEVIKKDYEPKDYMEYQIISAFFQKEGDMGYELVISKEEEEEQKRDVKIFVSRKEGELYCLKQVLDDKMHDGAAWDSEGLYLIDVDFDGEKDILVQNGHYGNQGAEAYACYLYRQGQYEVCESFTEILNASVDEENRLILSSWRNSAVCHGWGMYVYEDGGYHLKRVIEQEYLIKDGSAPEDGEYEIQWTIWEDVDKSGEGAVSEETITERFLESDHDEEFIREKIYARGSLWELSNYNRWNSFHKRPAFELSGRWFEKEIGGQKAWVALNDGAMIYFMTEGTEVLDVRFREITALETPYFAYMIDDGEPVRQLITESRIVLPDDKEHRVTIVVDGMTEFEDKWNGEIGVAFTGIDSGSGETMGIQPGKKRILFIGDSITEGVMALSSEANSNGNSATHSFPWYTAKQLDAEPYFMGYGGIGIVVPGTFSRCVDMIDHLSAARPVPKEEMPACDLAVIHIGTNDHEVEPKVFIQGYREVLEKLHERYPSIKIICMIPFTQFHSEDIRVAAEGYPWCITVETAGWDITYTDGVHPDAAGAQRIGKELAGIIRKEAGWQQETE